MLCYYNDRHYFKPLLLGIEWPGERRIIGDLGLGNFFFFFLLYKSFEGWHLGKGEIALPWGVRLVWLRLGI